VNDDPSDVVTALKSKPGRDIWLYGGGALFRSLLDAGLVDTVEVAVIPVLLGAGVPVLPPGAATKLELADQKTLPASGIVALAYSVPGGVGPAPRIRYIKAAKARPAKARSKKERDDAGQTGAANADEDPSAIANGRRTRAHSRRDTVFPRNRGGTAAKKCS
jgi:hypothetical protein